MSCAGGRVLASKCFGSREMRRPSRQIGAEATEAADQLSGASGSRSRHHRKLTRFTMVPLSVHIPFVEGDGFAIFRTNP